MKRLLALTALLHVATLTMPAAETDGLSFTPQTIGLPELSLARSIAQKSLPTSQWKFGARLPSYRAATPAFAPETSRPATTDRARPLGAARNLARMPIIKPNEAVDYKLRIIEPDPNIDPKMLVEVGPPNESTK